jgi:hypothetical protein
LGSVPKFEVPEFGPVCKFRIWRYDVIHK